MVVRGKGTNTERLPLPVDVGEAVVAYLQDGRPQAACRALFVRAQAPRVGLLLPLTEIPQLCSLKVPTWVGSDLRCGLLW